MSQWLVLAIAMALVCALVLTFTAIRHRRVAEDEDTSETPDVIEYMTMMVGVVYAIVLGLAIAGVWEARGTAEDDVRREARGAVRGHPARRRLPGPRPRPDAGRGERLRLPHRQRGLAAADRRGGRLRRRRRAAVQAAHRRHPPEPHQ
ncbi:hypothetical protein GCM10020254_20290 [Streptomyces goshikiensis]